MKKQVSAILAASMAASMLVACGGSTSSAATSTAPAESTSTASSEAAPAESTADAGQAADITLWTYPIGKWGDSESVDALLADFNASILTSTSPSSTSTTPTATIRSTPLSRAAAHLTSSWKDPSVWLPTGVPRA